MCSLMGYKNEGQRTKRVLLLMESIFGVSFCNFCSGSLKTDGVSQLKGI